MAAAVVGLALLVPSASTAAGAANGRPDPGVQLRPDLTVQLLGANGSGCPRGSAPAVAVDAHMGGAVTVRYKDFTVTGGDYKSCVVIVSVAAPAGWTYMIPSVQNQAWVELAAGSSARLATSMWFTGFDWTVRDRKSVAGPVSNYWRTTATPAMPMWAPCGESANLTIAETVRVVGTPSNTATLITTTFDSPIWQTC